jgi:hypothetical protein
MGLSRKKITIKGKNGKTFQRTMMVKSGGAVKRVRQAGGKGLLIGKTGSGTSFKHGLAAGGLLGASGVHRMGFLASAGSAAAQRGISHVAAHKSLKAHGQSGKTLGQKIKHVLANEAGMALGGMAGIAAHEGARYLRHKLRRK